MRIRPACVLLAGLALVAFTRVCVASGPATPVWFDGTWRITRLVGYGEISVSPQSAQQLIGQTVTIAPGQFRIGTDNCIPDTMHASMRATAPILLEQYRAGPADAGVGARAVVLDATPCGYVFRAGTGIVVFEGGAFYRAVRTAPPHRSH